MMLHIPKIFWNFTQKLLNIWGILCIILYVKKREVKNMTKINLDLSKTGMDG